MSRTRINSKWLSNCTGAELQQLNRLRLKGDSKMYDDVILAVWHQERIRIFLLKQEGKIIAWSSCILPVTKKDFKAKPIHATPPGTKKVPIYTYVNSKCRKKGYGRRLLKAAIKYTKESYLPVAFWWDSASAEFFTSVAATDPALKVFDIFEWRDVFGLKDFYGATNT